MKSIKIKVPAKINLTLDVLGTDEKGYHVLSSLVSSISLFDEVIIKKRKDKKINLKEKGIKCGCSVLDNNAFKAAKLYLKDCLDAGAEITLKKKIPVGGGLGGSSADIAGVLKGLESLYNFKAELKDLANALGSDSAYMLNGGWAIMRGRGEKIEKIDCSLKLYLIVVKEQESISAKNCYKKFDEQKKVFFPATERAIECLKNQDFDNFINSLKNDLTESAVLYLPAIKDNIETLKSAGAKTALMTGSGSSVYGVFLTEKDRNAAYKKLPEHLKKNAIKAETL